MAWVVLAFGMLVVVFAMFEVAQGKPDSVDHVLYVGGGLILTAMGVRWNPGGLVK
jgi:hypothetical protein